jgi:peptidoglycan/xylan/chitin deacetylase (PgdA/CDA1 family)
MTQFRVTKRGKLAILIFSIMFLMINISSISIIKSKAWKHVSIFENKAYAKTISIGNDNKLRNKSSENTVILVKKDNDIKKSSAINSLLQTTPQAVSIVKSSAKLISGDNENKLSNRSSESSIILVKKENTIKKSIVINNLLQTTPQAVSKEKSYVKIASSENDDTLINESSENSTILNKKDGTGKESPEIITPIQTTAQAVSVGPNNELSYPVELAYKDDGRKVAFLTFDDGPTSTNTPRILEILKHYDIKATFFIIGYEAEKNKDILIRIKNEGHAIGNHTYSHNYEKIYVSVEKFMVDIKKTDDVFKQILGEDFKTRICRFPGGSFGESKKPYIQELEEEGYADIDWNTITGDADGINVDKNKLVERLKSTAKQRKHLVILMHDSPSKNTTVEALPEIIEYLKAQGYEFATLK